MLPHLKTAEQFAAVMDASKVRPAADAAGWRGVLRSAHFALHLAPADLWPEQPAQQATLGVICPKRWAKRAVTRNTIKRQVYAVSSELHPPLPSGYFVVRLASGFARAQFKSATSSALKQSVRSELLALFGKITAPRVLG